MLGARLTEVAKEFTPRILNGDLSLAGEQRSLAYARSMVGTLQELHGDAVTSLHAWVPDVLAQLYEPLALMHERVDDHAEISTKMRVLGINGLGISVADGRKLAQLSLLSALRPSRRALLKAYAALNQDLDATLTLLRRVEGSVVKLFTLQDADQEYYIVLP